MGKKRLTEQEWQAVRAVCERGDQSIRAIAHRFGISESGLHKKRRHWAQQAPSKHELAKEEMNHLGLVQRLYHATDQQIQHLEQQLQSGVAAYDEKEARMLGTIARTLDKIIALTPKQQEKKSDGGGKQPANAAYEPHTEAGDEGSGLDHLREELARRLERLQQGTKSEIPGDP